MSNTLVEMGKILRIGRDAYRYLTSSTALSRPRPSFCTIESVNIMTAM